MYSLLSLLTLLSLIFSLKLSINRLNKEYNDSFVRERLKRIILLNFLDPGSEAGMTKQACSRVRGHGTRYSGDIDGVCAWLFGAGDAAAV